VRGAFRRHVRVRGQHDRGGIQRRAVRHRPGVRAGWRGRARGGPAARALQARQHPLRHRPGDLHVHELRPPRHGRRRAAQAGAAAAALRRRIRVLALTRVRVPRQPPARVAGLPAPAAVLPALPLRFLTLRAAAFSRPDRLLRGRRARIGAVHPQPALQLRQPQPQPPLPLPGRVKLGPQDLVLGILRLHHGAQPRQQLTMLRDHISQARLLRHKPQACSTRPQGSNTRQRRRVAQGTLRTKCGRRTYYCSRTLLGACPACDVA
jgi:hypothetical protein